MNNGVNYSLLQFTIAWLYWKIKRWTEILRKKGVVGLFSLLVIVTWCPDMDLSGETQENPGLVFTVIIKYILWCPSINQLVHRPVLIHCLQATRVNSFTDTRPQVMLYELRLKCNMGKCLQACWWSAEAHGNATGLLRLVGKLNFNDGAKGLCSSSGEHDVYKDFNTFCPMGLAVRYFTDWGTIKHVKIHSLGAMPVCTSHQSHTCWVMSVQTKIVRRNSWHL